MSPRTAVHLAPILALTLSACGNHQGVRQAEGSQASTPSVASIAGPTYSPGDNWWYDIKSGSQSNTTRFTVVSAGPQGIQLGFGQGPRFARTVKVSPSLNQLDPKGKEIVRIRHPMAVGDSWDSEYEWATPTAKGKVNVTRRVVAQESVKVGTMELEAFKVECNGFWVDYATASQSGGSTGRMTETYWYAPAAKNIVKLTAKSFVNIPGATQVSLDESYDLLMFKLVP